MMNLKKIYKKIPKVTGCKKGCTECCGPVLCTAEEFNAIPDILEKLGPVCDEQGERMLVCRFRSETGCLIYEHRPIVCRLFGAVNDVGMVCPYGAMAARPLNSRAAIRIVQRAGQEGLVLL
jgi:Fe-S-cluster containining protein